MAQLTPTSPETSAKKGKFFKKEKKQEIEQRLADLNYLCQNYDPYAPQIPTKVKKLLIQYDLNSETMDPFTITNSLLVMLDEAQAQAPNKAPENLSQGS